MQFFQHQQITRRVSSHTPASGRTNDLLPRRVFYPFPTPVFANEHHMRLSVFVLELCSRMLPEDLMVWQARRHPSTPSPVK